MKGTSLKFCVGDLVTVIDMGGGGAGWLPKGYTGALSVDTNGIIIGSFIDKYGIPFYDVKAENGLICIAMSGSQLEKRKLTPEEQKNCDFWREMSNKCVYRY